MASSDARRRWGCSGPIAPDIYGFRRKYVIGGEVYSKCPLSYLHDPMVSYALRLYPSYKRSGQGPNGPISNETAYYRDMMELIDIDFADAEAQAIKDAKPKDLHNGKTQT